ncbi:MAG: aminotransferase class IV [Pirellulales bacterium]|nr:aminotransferase class IV [Pirellulales bacterium]
MTPLAYINGKMLPSTDLSIPVDDLGFVQGVTVAERLRTFNGKLFRLNAHVERLRRSLEIIELSPPVDLSELANAAEELVARNHALLEPGDDLGLAMFVTPGRPGISPAGAQAVADRAFAGPIVAMHTQPLPFQHWVDKFTTGEELWISTIRQVPEACWPAELKCRSRMHYYLADLEARRHSAAARALLLDTDGNVSEASTANVVMFTAQEGLVAPPAESVLPGVSLATVFEFADQLKIPHTRRPITPQEIRQADEVLLCSTSMCVQPVTRLDGQLIRTGQPGKIFKRIIAAWGELVGVDIIAQAQRFARDRQTA